MFNTNWKEKYNQNAEKEMTAKEVFDMLEWEHNLIQDWQISNDGRRKYRKPFDMTLKEAAGILEHWRQQQ